MITEKEDPRRIYFYRVAVRIDGVEANLPQACVKLKLSGTDKFPSSFKIFWPTDGFNDQIHKASDRPADMHYSSHFLENARGCPGTTLCSYGLEIKGGVILAGATASKSGFMLVARRHNISAIRQETRSAIGQGQRLLRIENWWYNGGFPPGWIDVPSLGPAVASSFVTFEFRPLQNADNANWAEKWKTSLPKRICIHNDWLRFWWEGFSDISVPLSRIAGNSTAMKSTATLTTSRFASYPRTNPPSKREDRATQTSPEPGLEQGPAANRSEVPGDIPGGSSTEGLSTSTDKSSTIPHEVPKNHIPTKEELLEEASSVFIRVKLLELGDPDDLWSYTA
ncbi:hypothetical protein TWF481_011791 [Arthrobotrys musiformis]|uniref:Uncharacterized protein n=1 Tax=Arthrobotrys musiformis TaxID=47236 RepID=A0AAV9VVA9_9PEZI